MPNSDFGSPPRSLALGHGADYQQEEARRHGDGHFRFDGYVHNFPSIMAATRCPLFDFSFAGHFEFQRGDGCQDGKLEVRRKN